MNIAELKQQQRQGNSNVPAKPPRTIIDFLQGDKKIERAIAAVAGTYFTPDRFLRLAVNAIKKTPLLAQCDSNTVLGAFMTSAALGLEPNTVLQQAFLIPYKKRQKVDGQWIEVYECNFQIGARGFVTLAHRSPHVSTLKAEGIHEGDHFEHMEGSKSFLEYKKALRDRGDLIGAFCFTKMADGNEQATVLPLDEVYKIRARSETYIHLLRQLNEAISSNDQKEIDKAQRKFDETPWVMWQDDMAAKSAIKKHCKQLPISPGDALSVAAQIDSDDGRTIDMAAMTDPDAVKAVMKDGVDAAADLGADSGEAFGVRDHLLQDDPSPTLNTMTTRAAQAETVEVRQPAAQPQQQTLNVDERTPVEKLKHRLGSLNDLEMLDIEADLINSITADPGEQADLRNVYKARRAALTGDDPAARPSAPPPSTEQTVPPATRTRQRQAMSID